MKITFSEASRAILAVWAKHFESINRNGCDDLSALLTIAGQGKECDDSMVRSIVDLASEPVDVDDKTDAERKFVLNEIEKYKMLYDKTEQQKKVLERNLCAPKVTEICNCENFPETHKLALDDGWEAPPAGLVKLYLTHFKDNTEYDSDHKISQLLGINNSRRLREWASGEKNVPYDIWRKFLVMTGRDVCDIVRTIYIAV